MPDKESLFNFMEAFNDYDASDGAWWAMLEDSVTMYNKQNKTSYDPFESVHEWIKSRNETE